MADLCPLCDRDPALQPHLGAIEDALVHIEDLLRHIVVHLTRMDRERRIDHYGLGRGGMPREE